MAMAGRSAIGSMSKITAMRSGPSLHAGRAGETYNIGGENQPTNIQVVEEICAILDELAPDSGHTFRMSNCASFVADRPGHDRRYAMNIDKIRGELGWKPKEGLSSGLIKTVRWFLEIPNGPKDRPPARLSAWITENYQ